jgi:DNA mismatch endonuclease (patch repair protein)
MPPRKGYKQTVEHRAAISAAQKGAQNRPGAREHNSAAQKVAQNRPEVKARMSVLQKEIQNRPGMRAYQSTVQKEAQNRPETRERRCNTNALPEVKARMSAASKEVHNRPEVRAHHSDTLKISERAATARAQLCHSQASFPERLVAARLRAAGITFISNGRLHGLHHPYDFVLHDKKVVIEIDGCFWHSCPLHGPKQKWNSGFLRDAKADFHAFNQGYRVIRIWEHDVLAPKRKLKSGAKGVEIDAVSLVVPGGFKRARQFFN